MASSVLRATITASEPKNLQQMWLASGISSYVRDVAITKAPDLASASVEPHAVPPADGADRQGSSQQQPERAAAPRAAAPRRSRGRRPGKRATARLRVAPRASGRKAGKSTRKAAKK